MKFTFNQRSNCCGSKSVRLTSTDYPIDVDNPYKSVIQAHDRFYSNYRVQPLETLLTEDELVILRKSLPPHEFSVEANMLKLRGFPVITV